MAGVYLETYKERIVHDTTTMKRTRTETQADKNCSFDRLGEDMIAKDTAARGGPSSSESLSRPRVLAELRAHCSALSGQLNPRGLLLFLPPPHCAVGN